MAQKPFFMDAGIRVGDWVIYQDSAGDLQVAPANVVNLPQMPFTVDKGFKMGQFAWYQVDDDLKMSEDDSGLSQRPFIVDGGVRVGNWIIYVNTDAVIEVALASSVSVLSGVESSTQSAGAGGSGAGGASTISGGEGFATGYASTEWQTAADSATGNPRIIINVHYPTLDSDWKTALDNWAVGNTLVIKTPAQFDGTTLTTTGGISSTVSGDYKQYYFDVDVAHSNSVYVYQVEHTPQTTPAYTYAVTFTNSSGQEVTSVTEGGSYTITVTSNAPDGTYVWVSMPEELESGYSDPVTIDWLMDGTQSIARRPQLSGGQATIAVTINADETTETGYEKFRVFVSDTENYADIADHLKAFTPWITISDTSQDPAPTSLSDYNWTMTTSADITGYTAGNGIYIPVDDSSNHGQMYEGQTYTWEVQTDAPDGTEVWSYPGTTYVGTYDWGGDPSRNDIVYPGDFGKHTVSNGMISGTITVNADSYAENGEMVKIYIKDMEGWSGYTNLANSQWFHYNDEQPPASWDYAVTIVGSVPVATMEANTSFSGSFQQWYGGYDVWNGSINGSTFMNSGNNVWVDFHESVQNATESWNGNSSYPNAPYDNISIRVTVSINAQGYPVFYFESQNADQHIGWREFNLDNPDNTLATIGFLDVFTDANGDIQNIQVQPKANNYTIID